MPIEEIASGLFRIIGKLIGQVFLELIFEIILKGPGYIIVKLFSKNKEKEPSETPVFIVGVLFWVVIALIAFVVMKYVVK